MSAVQSEISCLSFNTEYNYSGLLIISPRAVNSQHFSSTKLIQVVPLFMFQDIRPMRDQIVRVKRFEKVPLILVGNKVDLESEREVAGSDGRALAQEWGCPFIETSAKSKTMVDELFAEIVRQMNYSTLPEKQEQCCTACVVQWKRGTSTIIPVFAWLHFYLDCAKALTSAAQLATH